MQVNSPARWRVGIAPARVEILEALRSQGPCSVAEIAAITGRSADGLYRHLTLLQKAGFVRELPSRKHGRHVERIFDATADYFMVEFNRNDRKAENDAIVATAKAFLRATERTVASSAKARRLRFTAADRNISINYELSWLTRERYEQVRKHIRAIKAVMDDAKAAREGDLYLTLNIAVPVTRKPRKTTRRSTNHTAVGATRAGHT